MKTIADSLLSACHVAQPKELVASKGYHYLAQNVTAQVRGGWNSSVGNYVASRSACIS
jgi:hypothetical protein